MKDSNFDSDDLVISVVTLIVFILTVWFFENDMITLKGFLVFMWFWLSLVVFSCSPMANLDKQNETNILTEAYSNLTKIGLLVSLPTLIFLFFISYILIGFAYFLKINGIILSKLSELFYKT